MVKLRSNTAAACRPPLRFGASRVSPLSGKPVVRGYLDASIVAVLVALFLITFVIRTFYIPSVSMVPTLAVGDVLLVDEIAYRLHRPAEGDIAVFVPPVAAGGSDYVKRVIGVPGDSIRSRAARCTATAGPCTNRT